MASNLFPMLSSSPPPMDDCPEDDDEDDEFGNFTAALPFDSSFDSPVASNKIKQFNSCDNRGNISSPSTVNNQNSLSNCSSPTPQEFVSDFSDEKENGTNYFIPVKDTKLKKSDINDPNVKNSLFNCSFVDSSQLTPGFVFENDLGQSQETFSNGENSLSTEIVDADIRTNAISAFSAELDLPVPSFDAGDKKNNAPDNVNVNKTLVACHSDKCHSDNDPDHISEGLSFELESDKKLINNTHDDTLLEDSTEFDMNIPNCVLNLENEKDFIISHDEHDKRVSPTEDVSNQNSNSKYSKSEKSLNSCNIEDSRLDKKNNSSDPHDDFDDFQSCNNQLVLNLADHMQNSESDKVQSIEVHDSDIQLPVDSKEQLTNFVGYSSLECHYENPSAQPDDSKKISDFQQTEEDEFTDFQSPFSAQNNCERFSEQSIKFTAFEADFSNFQDAGNVKEEDEFADFQDFGGAVAGPSEEFADFSAASFQSNDNLSFETSDSEFTDFAKASLDAPAESTFQTFSSQKTLDPLSTVINAVFPLSEKSSEEFVSDEPSLQILEQSNKSRRLWEKLNEVEQAPSLRFQWGVSHSFQQLLHSVNVDYHSILRTSSVPIFASGLSLLEPVKDQTNLVNNESEDRNHTLRNSIPPVNFDWSGSGLINPLDSGQTSTLMDLSFLSSVKTTSSATSSDHSFENELLKPSPELPSPETSKTQILEQLLSKNVSSLPNPSFSHRPPNLSKEAVHVLDHLPDLSFMQAKVLMFPIMSNKT